MEKMAEHVANAYRGISTTSNAVGTGSKTWTVTNSNSQIPAFAVGMPVRVARTSAPTITYVQGEVTAFTPATGSTTVNVSSSLGSGTHTDWTIVIGGHQTTASASPLGVAAGGTGAGTHTANNVLVGAGTGAVTSVAPSTSGNVLTSNRSAWTSAAGTDLTAIADGSVGSPSLANSWNTNTGVYFPAADTVGVVTGGTERFRFGSNPIPGGSKNMLINGAMMVNQRGSVTATVNTQLLDMFASTLYDAGTSAVATVTKDADFPAGFGSSMKFDVTTISTGGGAYNSVKQRIEGQNLQHLNYGTAGALTCTFSFWFKTTITGIYSAYFYHSDASQTFVREFTVAVSNTWEFFEVTVPGYTSTNFNTGTATGLEIGITLASDMITASSNNVWQAGGDTGGSVNQVNGLSSTSNSVFTTGWQFEVGDVATDFAHEDYGTTLAKCQRYFYSTNLYEQSTRWLLGAYDAGNALGSRHTFPVQMRVAPTAAFTSSVFRSFHEGSVHDATITIAFVEDQFGYQPYITAQASGTQGEVYFMGDNGGDASNGNITFTAEL